MIERDVHSNDLFKGAPLPGQLTFPEEVMQNKTRQYKLEGVLSPTNWDEILMYLSELGLSATCLEYTEEKQSQDESADLSITGKQEFYDFADANGYSHIMAGKIWMSLTRLYSKRWPEDCSVPSRFDKAGYEHVPEDLFAVYPEDDGSGHAANVSGLKLSGIDTMIAQTEVDIRKIGLSDAIREHFDFGFGPNMYKFLNEFSAHKHAQISAALAAGSIAASSTCSS